MKRKDAIPYISFCLDDTLGERDIKDMPSNARLIGWQCGFEPLFVAVWSYLPGIKLNGDDAEEIARDFLRERKWFVNNDETNEADYVI